MAKKNKEQKDKQRTNTTTHYWWIRRVAMVTNPVISHEWGNGRIVITTGGT
jgi:hypothetical protein